MNVGINLGVTELSTSYNQATLAGKVSEAMLAKGMDMNEQLGEGLVQMIDAAAMERSVNPAVGGNMDVSV
ncbi:MAG: YjfB family protein [Lachnospiraceae bacterium]|nr:YjfB family protein [Lachnospiraceae bacterium]MCR5476641.1 YjfB family protein [Lachnospiraceae bacterium]